MPIPVVADADVLFAGTTRALLINMDYQGLIHLHWSPLILDEMSRALVAMNRKPDLDSAKENEARMDEAIPSASLPVRDVQARYKAVHKAVNSAKDTHVAAAAYLVLDDNYYDGTMAVALVSKNITDYNVPALAAMGVQVSKPDAFLLAQLQLNPEGVATAFRNLRLSLASQPKPKDLLVRLVKDGQAQTAAALELLEQQGRVQL